MDDVRGFVKSLFDERVSLDYCLKSILEKEILRNFDVNIDIKNLKFVETASHTMFFNSKKRNSSYNSPLNSIIFSRINNSNISISLATEKIKMNNYSSPLYLDFFGENVRIMPNSKSKNSDVFCLSKLPKQKLLELKKIKDILYKQILLKSANAIETKYFSNKGCIENIHFLDKKILENKKIVEPNLEKFKFKNGIYDGQIEDLSSYCFKNLASQVNYSQTNLINDVYISKNKHYYLSLEEIASKLLISKVKNKDCFLSELFKNNILHKDFSYSLFLKKKKNSLIEVKNSDLVELSVEQLCLYLREREYVPNVKFSLLLVSLYGLEILGGRYQKEYMKDFSEKFLNLVHKMQIDTYDLDSIKCRLKNLLFFDISSLIIYRKDNKEFCYYDILLEKPLNVDNNIENIIKKQIKEVQKDTMSYLEERKGK